MTDPLSENRKAAPVWRFQPHVLQGLPVQMGIRIGSLGISLGLIAVIVILANADPLEVAVYLGRGAFGTEDQMARVIATLAPLVLCCSGLMFTFATGLYNLGVEGQITMGAVAATWITRGLPEALPSFMGIGLALLAGVGGGTLWGLLAGILNRFGRVNEIFAGLGLNFVAQGVVLYLIFGPWKRAGIASMSGTELLPETLWLPTWGQTEASPVALGLSLVIMLATIGIMRDTYFGLQLRAVGQNPRAAFVLGIPATQRFLSAFGLCGATAGLAGAIQVVGVFHRLLPNISSNLGFLALLVVLLIQFNPLWILPVAFFFSALNIGSLQLPLALNLESSLAGVIQGMLVLLALLGQGLSRQILNRSSVR